MLLESPQIRFVKHFTENNTFINILEAYHYSRGRIHLFQPEGGTCILQ